MKSIISQGAVVLTYAKSERIMKEHGNIAAKLLKQLEARASFRDLPGGEGSSAKNLNLKT